MQFPIQNNYQQNYSCHYDNNINDHSNTYQNSAQMNRDLWCETCDRGFDSLIILENHKKQHQKCNIDGCQFTAHPKVITKHIQMQHSTGIYKKIANLNNPEDIKKWREERKRRYPTRVNIEKKEAEIKEKVERGEKLGLKQFKKFGNQDRKYQNKTHEHKNKPNSHNKKNFRSDFKQKKDRRNFNKLNNDDVKHKPNPKVPPTLAVYENKFKLKPFLGISSLIFNTEQDEDPMEDNSVPIEDDEYDITVVKTEEPKICNVLTSLIGDYGSSSEDENVSNKKGNSNQINTKQQQVNKDNISNLIVNVKQQINIETTNKKQCDSDDSGPEETKIVVGDNLQCNNESPQPINIKRKHDLPNKRNILLKKRLNTNLKAKLPSTLLEKLLQREIQHERNIALQCIRHIVNNKYFE